MCDYADSRRGDDSGITGITQLREAARCKGSRLMGHTKPYRVHGRVGLRQITVMQPRMRLYAYIDADDDIHEDLRSKGLRGMFLG